MITNSLIAKNGSFSLLIRSDINISRVVDKLEVIRVESYIFVIVCLEDMFFSWSLSQLWGADEVSIVCCLFIVQFYSSIRFHIRWRTIQCDNEVGSTDAYSKYRCSYKKINFTHWINVNVYGMKIVKYHSLVIVSYNCKGFNISKVPVINKILQNCDIVLLQETWLFSIQFHFFN